MVCFILGTVVGVIFTCFMFYTGVWSYHDED